LFTRRFLFSTLAVIACAVPASATISYYTDPTAYNTATTDLTSQNVDFSSLIGTFFDSTTLDTILFTGLGSYHNAGGELTAQSSPGGTWPAGAVLTHSVGTGLFNAGGSITVTFPSAVEAFAFYGGYVASPDSLDIVVATAADSLHLTPFITSTTAPYFLGIRTDLPITGLTISAQSTIGEQLGLGGFSFDTAGTGGTGGGGGDGGTTPEPASFLLIGTGLASVAFLRRRLGRG
jgi:hypothetical protein